MITIVDTDALLAIMNPNDALHTRAKAIVESIYQMREKSLLLLPTTLAEFALLATHHIGLAQARSVIEVWMQTADHILLEMNDALTIDAVAIFSAQTSKKESLFDCYVMAAAKKYKADCIFSFDKGYTKQQNKFLLTSDVIL